jgi:hypothetical protein
MLLLCKFTGVSAHNRCRNRFQSTGVFTNRTRFYCVRCVRVTTGAKSGGVSYRFKNRRLWRLSPVPNQAVACVSHRFKNRRLRAFLTGSKSGGCVRFSPAQNRRLRAFLTGSKTGCCARFSPVQKQAVACVSHRFKNRRLRAFLTG